MVGREVLLRVEKAPAVPGEESTRPDVSMATIYLWIRQGKLATVKVGADQRVLVEELEKFLKEGRGATSAVAAEPSQRARRARRVTPQAK